MCSGNIFNGQFINICKYLTLKPQAQALIHGSSDYPKIRGTMRFYSTPFGVLVASQVAGLPDSRSKCKNPIFAFHIHSGESCSGNKQDQFANVGTHLNLQNCPHPYHTGDMPPLFGNSGKAVSVFLTNRFEIKDIIGKTVIIHSSTDDFKSQPGGNAGIKIACGEIK